MQSAWQKMKRAFDSAERRAGRLLLLITYSNPWNSRSLLIGNMKKWVIMEDK
jgi:hypothetical protein